MKSWSFKTLPFFILLDNITEKKSYIKDNRVLVSSVPIVSLCSINPPFWNNSIQKKQQLGCWLKKNIHDHKNKTKKRLQVLLKQRKTFHYESTLQFVWQILDLVSMINSLWKPYTRAICSSRYCSTKVTFKHN